MRNKRDDLYRLGNKSQRGNAMLGVIALALMSVLLCIAVFNNGRAVNEKVMLTNAADAAAYSGAVWAARNLNFMAYTNRAIFANHAVVGHLVSYMSWLRFYANFSDKVSLVLQFFPYLGKVIYEINKMIQEGKEFSEKVSAPLIVNSVTFVNNRYFDFQNLSRLQGVLTIQQIIDKTAKAYDSEVRVNHPSDFAEIAKELLSIKDLTDIVTIHHTDVGGLAKGMKMYWNYYTFTSQFTLGRDVEFNRKKRGLRMMDKTIFGMKTGNSIASSGLHQQNWFVKRDWTISAVVFDLFRKKGSTKINYHKDQIDWVATDYIQMRQVKKLFIKWKRILSTNATASEFSLTKKYKGFPGYQELSRDVAKDQRLQFVALTSKVYKPLSAMEAVKPDAQLQRLMALGKAEVFYRRPLKDKNFIKGFRKPPNTEYSNLFNPFWHARLI